ncbi:MAG: 30S ribosomal protein S18 [Actinomycetia bacterium]|nr:30S ribosomal protein S18 [Actinomycetes bacterium]
MAGDFQRKPRRKFCGFCKDKVDYIDYKDVALLKRYMSEKGKIRPRRITGNCTQHQRDLAIAVKRAREVALIAYSRK